MPDERNALVKMERFLPVAENYSDMKLVIADNIGSTSVSPFDLTRVRIPAAGGTTWDIDGEVSSVLECIIAQWQDVRAYWPGEEFQGATPPQCSSLDGKQGRGEPGGECRVCPFAQWDTGKGSHGQACKAMRRLMLVLPDRLLPAMLSLPPTSLKACTRYFVNLVSKRTPYWQAVTHIGLEGAQTPAGVKYAVATFKQRGRLSEEEAERFAGYRAGIERLSHAAVASDEYANGAKAEPVDLGSDELAEP